MVEISFAGGRDIEGPTTWAQEEVWRGIRPDRPNDGYANVRFAIPVRPGTGVSDIAAVVERIMAVHEGLRTTFPTTGAAKLDVQRVHSSGVIDVPAVELGERAVEAFAEDWGQRSFDTRAEWPARFAIALSDGIPTALVVAVSHLVADKYGESALVSDLRALLSGQDVWTGADRVTAVGRGAEEATDRLKAISHRALARWEDVLGSDDLVTFGAARSDTDVWRRASLLSPQATIAAEEIAARVKVSSAGVFMAATGVLAATLSSRASVAMASLLSNRFSESEAAFVGSLVQPWGLVLDVGSRSFPDIVRATYGASLRSYRMGRYDRYDVEALRSELRERKGLAAPPWFDVLHNDSRSARARATVSRGTGERVATRLPDLHRFGLGYSLFVEVRDVGEWADITVFVNSRFVSPSDPLALAAAVEQLLIRVAGGADGPAAAVMAAALDERGGDR